MRQYKYYYRVSKYDPAFRNGGVFTKADWTSYADIGKAFEGHMFTLEDYLRVEKRYIQFILDVVNACKGNKLRLVYLEASEDLLWRVGQTLSDNDLIGFWEDCMREKCWGQLENDTLLIEHGYDFYVHIGCNLPQETVKCIAANNQLYVELWEPFAAVE